MTIEQALCILAYAEWPLSTIRSKGEPHYTIYQRALKLVEETAENALMEEFAKEKDNG